MTGRTKKETRQLLQRGEKLKATVRRFSGYSSSIAALLGGGRKNDTLVLSVTLPGELESWNVLASGVRVTCVPRDAESVRQYFPGLPEINWVPE